MFTGIIEEIGEILEIKKNSKSAILTVGAQKVLEGTVLGDSIALNGVCLTVTAIRKDNYDVDVMPETMRQSNLGQLKCGAKVNLERALALGSRLGGHLVSGHIDGTGTIHSLITEDNAVWVTVVTAPSILKYIIARGSVAIDGISLTVADVNEWEFKIAIIPHTSGNTCLLEKKPGDTINLECDVIGKYVEKMLLPDSVSNSGKSTITKEFLAANGFE